MSLYVGAAVVEAASLAEGAHGVGGPLHRAEVTDWRRQVAPFSHRVRGERGQSRGQGSAHSLMGSCGGGKGGNIVLLGLLYHFSDKVFSCTLSISTIL